MGRYQVLTILVLIGLAMVTFVAFVERLVKG